ncbi:AraC family transcriptional regulator [Vitreoscilla massiliensis]|uniref:AraC family transcriptional regulator n=1 Tax=Vitreoscilla massiliensis TaxID=1689272 RepID=A0ABY4E6T0_9NEIS|nr:AraC family transcriptional regulator [Vitreoscilla massiliensis]UOO91169.1 AraC family transcriptional regulator [Vitreoscilla massiliensis]
MSKPTQNWIHTAPSLRYFERIEAFFSSYEYAPHRHDTYAIGTTLSGVQSFNYRGTAEHSTRGQVIVLHPDEKHDGRAGTEHGYHYHMLYIQPALFQDILQGQPLPFIEHGLSRDAHLHRILQRFFQQQTAAINTLTEEDTLFDLVTTLQQLATSQTSRNKLADGIAAARAREYLDAHWQNDISLADLEACSGRDRWRLSRDFRLLYGTSPHRYQIMRRLDHVKASLLAGATPVDAAYAAGFFDQSHMHRHFVASIGMPPARWQKLLLPSHTAS